MFRVRVSRASSERLPRVSYLPAAKALNAAGRRGRAGLVGGAGARRARTLLRFVTAPTTRARERRLCALRRALAGERYRT